MFRYFGGLPDKITGKVLPAANDKVVTTTREPYGVIAAITAWNYPLFNACAKIAPIIATGNACILKPAEETPLTALRLAEIIASVPGVPEGLVAVLNGRGGKGELIVAAPE
jgi:acyl-CoA reductase-like NAD-dependent aldehyde dehydrogenase